jgi:DNA-directed RNA polymerase specialized sigma24 family protein
MNKDMVLSTFYQHYKNGHIGRKLFEAKILGEIAYRTPIIIGKDRKMDLSDFFAWLYPRIANAIDNYEDNGSSFDAYIYIIVSKAYKEYHAIAHDHKITEKTVWSCKEYERVAENEGQYPADKEEEELPPFRSVQNPHQILILMLKSYYFLSDDFISRIAPALHVSKERINMLIMELHDLRAAREQEIHDLRERVYAQFYRCLSFQSRMDLSEPNSARQQRFSQCLDRGIKRLNAMRETLRTLHADASNKEVAKVLGISKGTVDASLFTVRQNYLDTLSGRSDSAPSI